MICGDSISNKNQLLCVIPARGGSKRLPRKNIKILANKPMIAYSIEEALKSKLFNKVYVATEDSEIADVAKSYGAVIPDMLPLELTGDAISSLEPCLYLADYLKNIGEVYDTLFCVQPTSPLRIAMDFQQSFGIFEETKADFLLSVTPIDPHYFHWALKETQNHKWGTYFGQVFLKERIYLPSIYRPNGAIKIGRIKALKKVRNFFGDNLRIYNMPEERAVHIATQFDFDVAEMLLKKRLTEGDQ